MEREVGKDRRSLRVLYDVLGCGGTVMCPKNGHGSNE